MKIPEFFENAVPSQESRFLRIARNNYSGVKFREEKFLGRSGSLYSRNFIPEHLTPLRKINSPGIYFPDLLRNQDSWIFLTQEFLFLTLLGIYVPEENIFLASVIVINNMITDYEIKYTRETKKLHKSYKNLIQKN